MSAVTLSNNTKTPQCLKFNFISLFVNDVSALLHPAGKNCVTEYRQCILENVITIVILYHIYCETVTNNNRSSVSQAIM